MKEATKMWIHVGGAMLIAFIAGCALTLLITTPVHPILDGPEGPIIQDGEFR